MNTLGNVDALLSVCGGGAEGHLRLAGEGGAHFGDSEADLSLSPRVLSRLTRPGDLAASLIDLSLRHGHSSSVRLAGPLSRDPFLDPGSDFLPLLLRE